jgi:hypothetical protein
VPRFPLSNQKPDAKAGVAMVKRAPNMQLSHLALAVAPPLLFFRSSFNKRNSPCHSPS